MQFTKRVARLGLHGLLGLALASCGQVRLTTPTAKPSPRPVRVAAHADDAAAWVARLAEFQANLQTYAAIITFWEEIPGESATNTAEVYTAKPAKIRANITESTSFLKRGAKILYLGDKQVTIKLGFIKQTYPYGHTKVTSLHDWRIDETDLSGLIGDVIDPLDVVTDLGPTMVGETPAHALSVTGPGLLPGVQEERMVLDAQTASPLHFEAIMGGKVVYRLDMKSIKLNPVLPPNTFTL